MNFLQSDFAFRLCHLQRASKPPYGGDLEAVFPLKENPPYFITPVRLTMSTKVSVANCGAGKAVAVDAAAGAACSSTCLSCGAIGFLSSCVAVS
eukprot:5557515-Amphidinium_carterae.1